MKLDDLIRESRESLPRPDWQTLDVELFERIEAERGGLQPAEERPRRVRFAPIAVALSAAAAAAILLGKPSTDASPGSTPSQASSVVYAGERIEARDSRYFDTPEVRWMAAAGSILRVERAASPLVLSLEQGATEAQVTPVPAGEAFAVDVTASSGAVVRVAVHGTHLRVARDRDEVVIDLTEGVVSIGAPPRRGSLIGTLVTAPAHVSFDARDLSSIRIEHAPASVRAAEPMRGARTEPRVAIAEARPQPLIAVAGQPPATSKPQQGISKSQPTALMVPAPATDVWLRTPAEVASAIAACGQASPNWVFSSTLTMRVGDDGLVQVQPVPRFDPPLPPEARDCAANVIYKRVKLGTPGDVSIPIEIRP